MSHTAASPAQAAHSHTNRDGNPDAQGPGVLHPSDTFLHRHIGPSEAEIAEMLETLGATDLETFTDKVVPETIRVRKALTLAGLPDTLAGEHETLNKLLTYATQNKVFRSFIGTGYYGTITPGVILRNILENPGWYTQYTPYQAEIAQGRLEALLNFQTMVSDLTGLPLAGASLLDEATAAAEAMTMCWAIHEHARPAFLIAKDCHPQTLAVCQTRAEGLGIDLRVVDAKTATFDETIAGILVQTPSTDGSVIDYRALVQAAHAKGTLVVVATDLLALTLTLSPGEIGADVAVGSAQRFGVPMGFGGPHAAFIATREEYVRKLPGRIIGVSKDAQGNRALRMAIQTREQHIRRDKATSNICTAQALLAIIAGMYACYHGPEGLRRIALRAHSFARILSKAASDAGHSVLTTAYFDTVTIRPGKVNIAQIRTLAEGKGINLRYGADGTVAFSCDEATTMQDVRDVADCLAGGKASLPADLTTLLASTGPISNGLARQTGYLTHPVFNTYHSEHEMLRYIFRLMGRDLSLTHSMISLGSCTMKLNATSEMIPVTWKHFGGIHPFAPQDQSAGYRLMFRDLENWLTNITGFAAMSLQPNAGAAGEYAGLMVIRAYHHSRGDKHRTICLIPESAHGTNPASAVVAGFDVVPVKNTPSGDIDIDDLLAKAEQHKANLGALMVTYPSTYGVFEEHIKQICEIVHARGGQVYMDGANMNAQVGLTSPGAIGADVCHLNLHKTFCIPHGGGGPGMGPIGVASHLAPFLPGHPVSFPSTLKDQGAGAHAIGAVSAAPYGSPSILVISWMYIAMMGAAGLRRATQIAILNANYMAKRLEGHYDVLFKGKNGNVAHEFIIDVRPFDKSAGIKTDDIAKRLMDFGFHAPTMSWPVPGTLMIEPTESEPKGELDRFCDAMIKIREEIRAIEAGTMDKASNPLKHAPHTMHVISDDAWNRPYTRQQAAFPLPWVKETKFWPSVGRVDNPYGDRNLICTCPPMEEYVK